MTIYYVDPATGSNTNNGLSWSTAWRWLPGNGTAIVAGDEVRFAKSQQRTTTQTYAFGTSSNIDAGGLYTVAANMPISTWTAAGVAGVTGTSGGVSIANNATVPANTKLGYIATSITVNTNYGLAAILRAYWAPVAGPGETVKFCLCSDTAGNTVVATLTGRTSSHPTAGDWVGHLFEFNNGSTVMNFTVGSIALYSGTQSFTNTSGSAITLAVYGELTTTPNQTTEAYMRPGDYAVVAPGYHATTPSAVVGIRQLAFFTNSGLPALGRPPMRLSYSDVSTTILRYVAPSIGLNEWVSLSFSGAAGNPVKLRGGWNTATNTQDGYTNLVPPVFGSAPYAVGCFTFSSGGDYLELERFLAGTYSLVYWSWVTGTTSVINSISVTDCSFPCFGIPTAATRLTLQEFTATRSFIEFLPVVTKPSGTTTYTKAATTAGTWTFTDCVVSRHSDTTSSEAITLNTRFEMNGTASGKALLAGSSAIIYFANNSPGLVKLSGINIGSILTIAGCTSTAATSAPAIEVSSCRSVGTLPSGYGLVKLNTFYNYTISDLYGSASGTYAAWVIDAGAANPPWTVPAGGIGTQCTISGVLQLDAGTGLSVQFTSLDEVIPVGVTTGTSAIYPQIGFTDCRKVNWSGGSWSVFAVNYTLGAAAFPISRTTPSVEIVGATAHFSINAPEGWVTLTGCTLRVQDDSSPVAPFNSTGSLSYSRGNTSDFPIQSADTYGCTIVGNAAAPTLSTSSPVVGIGFPRTRHLGLSVSGTLTVSYASSGMKNGWVDMYFEPGSLVTWGIGGFLRQLVSVRGHASALNAYRCGNSTFYPTTTTNAYGRKDLLLIGFAPVGRIYVPAGRTLNISGIVLSASTVQCFRLIVFPTDGFEQGLLSHVLELVQMTGSNVEIPFSFNVAPTQDAMLIVGVHVDGVLTTNRIRKIDFTVT